MYRELTWSGFWRATRATAETTAVIFAIIAMAVYFSIIMTYTKTPQAIVQFFIEYNIGPITFFVLAGVAIIILGTFMEAVPVFYLTLPIMYPICHCAEDRPAAVLRLHHRADRHRSHHTAGVRRALYRGGDPQNAAAGGIPRGAGLPHDRHPLRGDRGALPVARYVAAEVLVRRKPWLAS